MGFKLTTRALALVAGLAWLCGFAGVLSTFNDARTFEMVMGSCVLTLFYLMVLLIGIFAFQINRRRP